jgi:hypothetical protein
MIPAGVEVRTAVAMSLLKTAISRLVVRLSKTAPLI